MSSIGSLLRAPILPQVAPLGGGRDTLLTGALFLLGLFLPFSVAGVSILTGVLLLLAVACAPSVWRAAPWRDPVVACALLLFTFISLHSLGSSRSPSDALAAINHYDELLVLPLLLALLRLSSKPNALVYGMITGSVGYALSHWAVPWIPGLAEKILTRSISAGLTLSLTAVALLERARTAKTPRLFYALALFLGVTVLFKVQGRTGQIILVLTVVYAIWVYLPRRWRLVGSVTAPLVLLALSLNFGAVSIRVADTFKGMGETPDASQTSTRIRWEMLILGLDLARKNYLTGVGFSNYAKANEMASEARDMRDTGRVGPPQPWAQASNPHNEYLLQLVGGGVISLGLFLAWLGLPMLRLRGRKPDPWLCIVTLAFATGCLFNSMLLDFTEGHFYTALLAWFLLQSYAPEEAGPTDVPA